MRLPVGASYAEEVIRKKAPNLPDTQVAALAAIWDEVVHKIITEMLASEQSDERPLHINMRAEMSFEISRLLQFFTEQVISKRIGDRDLHQIDPSVEQSECFDSAGLQMIETTAANFREGHWKRRMEERWLPKSQKAFERERVPPPATKLSVKPVNDKHFISRWFIRDHWAEGPHATRWRKLDSRWSRKTILFGSWGHRQGLWSDRLEAYFGLLEGDAKRPLQMLLEVQPLNQPQELAFVAHLVVHILRNPSFVQGLRHNTRDILELSAQERGVTFEEMARAAYETLYQNNAIYDAYARPLLWSRWAVISSAEPAFVLPDTFCARGAVNGTPRVFAPLTPQKCFVTLSAQETEKSIVPIQHLAAPKLARRISQLLIDASGSEFLAHSQFDPGEARRGPAFAEVLAELEVALAKQS